MSDSRPRMPVPSTLARRGKVKTRSHRSGNTYIPTSTHPGTSSQVNTPVPGAQQVAESITTTYVRTSDEDTLSLAPQQGQDESERFGKRYISQLREVVPGNAWFTVEKIKEQYIGSSQPIPYGRVLLGWLRAEPYEPTRVWASIASGDGIDVVYKDDSDRSVTDPSNIYAGGITFESAFKLLPKQVYERSNDSRRIWLKRVSLLAQLALMAGGYFPQSITPPAEEFLKPRSVIEDMRETLTYLSFIERTIHFLKNKDNQPEDKHTPFTPRAVSVRTQQREKSGTSSRLELPRFSEETPSVSLPANKKRKTMSSSVFGENSIGLNQAMHTRDGSRFYNHMKEQQATARKKASDLEKAKARLEKQVAELQKKLESSEEEKEELRTELSRVEEVAASTQEENKILMDENSDLKKLISDQVQTIEKLQKCKEGHDLNCTSFIVDGFRWNLEEGRTSKRDGEMDEEYLKRVYKENFGYDLSDVQVQEEEPDEAEVELDEMDEEF